MMKDSYFAKFDASVSPYLENLGIPAYIFYGTLFHNEYRHILKDDDKSNVGMLFADGVQIAQWRGGKPLPERIYALIHANPVSAMDRYEEDLGNLFSAQGLKEEDLEYLENALQNYINEIKQYCVILKPLKQTAAHLCAYAFVNTIFCGGIDAHCMNWLSYDMKRMIEKVQSECKKSDVALTNARILCSLCGENSLLLNILNTVDIGERWSENLNAYIEKQNHRQYSNSMEHNEWLYLAIILAGRNGRIKADETDMVCAIMRTSHSSTLSNLMNDLKEHGIDPSNWDELVLRTDKERSKSSFISILSRC